jgi:hypothetical protein
VPCHESIEHRAYRLAHGGEIEQRIGEAAREWGISPFVFLALALVESHLDPRRVHKRTKAAGIFQLTPGGRRAIARLTGQPFTREMALDPSTATHGAVVLLAHHVSECGSLVRALGAYGSGKCSGAGRFARYVLRRANRLRISAGLPPLSREQPHPFPACV